MTLLGAPFFLSLSALGVYSGESFAYGRGFKRKEHPIAFWVITLSVFALGLMFLVMGAHDLFVGRA